MNQTFTFTVKFPVGTKVYFADSDGAYIPQYHPHIYSGVISEFSLDSSGEVHYQFANQGGRYNHTRREKFVFATPEEVVEFLNADIDGQVAIMKDKTKELLNFPIPEGEYGR